MRYFAAIVGPTGRVRSLRPIPSRPGYCGRPPTLPVGGVGVG